MSLVYQLKPRWLLSFNYTQASGARITTPTSFYYYRGYQVPVYTEQNNDRLPSYTRFDFSTTIQLNQIESRFNHSISFALYNMLGNENPYAINFSKTLVDDQFLIPADKLNIPDQVITKQFTFKILPSFTYQFNF
jgi:hypothetical protein